MTSSKKNKGPKILVLDVETKPIKALVWDVWEVNIPLNMITEDWSILAWSAKWLGEDKVMYMDQRHNKNYMNDKKILQGIRDLMDEADIIITQNGKSFDEKRLFGRFLINGIKRPSSYKHIDTKRLAKRFHLTSYKLEYMAELFNKKYKKSKHSKFPGMSLWTECLKGNQKAWKAMEIYNKYDVLALEELYYTLAPWDNSINFEVYYDDEEMHCSCGSKSFKKNGFAYTAQGKYQRYVCNECGRERRSGKNLLTKEKKASLTKKS